MQYFFFSAPFHFAHTLCVQKQIEFHKVDSHARLPLNIIRKVCFNIIHTNKNIIHCTVVLRDRMSGNTFLIVLPNEYYTADVVSDNMFPNIYTIYNMTGWCWMPTIVG